MRNFQRTGSFKFRGAYNRIAGLSPQERERGVVAYSSGNYAQGVALAGKLLGTPATIVMPEDAPALKVAATRGYGAEVVFYSRSEEDRAAIAKRICDERGATLVAPFDDARVIAGQGTATVELLEEAGKLDMLFVPLGGGGLLSGALLAAQGINPSIEVYGVEPDTGNDFQQSIAAGKRVAIPVPQTIADGLQVQFPGDLTFPIVRRYAKGVVTVSDAELMAAMRFAFERLKVVIEPSGAAGLAAVMSAKVDVRKKRVGIIVSGGNVDGKRFAQAIR